MATASVTLGADEVDDVDVGSGGTVMHQKSLLANERGLADELAKLQPVAGRFNLHLRAGREIDAVKELLRNRNASCTVDGDPHGSEVSFGAPLASTVVAGL